ncbi:MAG TPA: RagB/SusD family nutrient uptake outer membrane protein [Prolixibacteraceae bacterium]|nr:RagB/SusD family nutrient uptake outer membrane protein [Prolixibacteraceae bacterium]HPR85625.1 RagB/SusD family nutrient uptake outer membrane protein [Prolixibacteraceae bacterium]
MGRKALYLLFLLITFSGCDFGFIDRPQLAVQTADDFYKTADDAKAAVTSVYNYFQKYDFEVSRFEFGDIASDDAEKGGESDNDRPFVKDLEYFRTRSDNFSCAAIWNICFRAIYQANYAIENITPIDMDATLKQRFIAELRFIRAHFYFYLKNIFGEMPLITKVLTSLEYHQPKATSEAIWNQIESDLIFARDNLPLRSKYEQSDLGRITKGAAQALLANVYLFQKKWALAKKEANDVILSGEYKLEPQFGDLFQIKKNDFGVESIFEIPHQTTNTGWGDDNEGTVVPVFCRSRNAGGWGFNCPTFDLLSEFEPGDPRLIHTFMFDGDITEGEVQYNQSSPSHLCSRKVFLTPSERIGFDSSDAPFNFKEIRYAEVLLIHAEAACENGHIQEALNSLNQVRKRARESNAYDSKFTFKNINKYQVSSGRYEIYKFINYDFQEANANKQNLLPDVKTTDQQALRMAIRHERRVELAMENKRFYDIIRWGDAETHFRNFAAKWNTGKGSQFRKNINEIFPIPQGEIDVNPKMTQNPGY